MKINIGTNEKNIQRVNINKKFEDIELSDINKIVLKELGHTPRLIYGWAQSPRKTKKQITL